MADDLTTKILTDYPSFAYLLHDAEIGPLLLEAVNPDVGFDSQTFQAKLMQTNWWKNSSATQRQWETLVATDPATATAQKATWKTRVNQLAGQYGVNLTPFNLEDWANTFLSQGVQADDPRIVNALVSLYSSEPAFRSGHPGNLQTITDQAKQLADQYMINLTAADYAQWSQRIARGESTIQAFQDDMKMQAMDRYSAYAQRIDAGATPQQIFSQQRNAIAQELEVDPSTIDLMRDPRWSKVLGVRTSDGTVQPMTYHEAVQLARSQPEYKRTTGGQQQAASVAEFIDKTFGKVKT